MASILERGQKYVQELGLANARDIVKMIQWNHKYSINFMRLSSGMFPFASLEEYGYSLAPFARLTSWPKLAKWQQRLGPTHDAS
jgi:UV DNA damage endonuclease